MKNQSLGRIVWKLYQIWRSIKTPATRLRVFRSLIFQRANYKNIHLQPKTIMAPPNTKWILCWTTPQKFWVQVRLSNFKIVNKMSLWFPNKFISNRTVKTNLGNNVKSRNLLVSFWFLIFLVSSMINDIYKKERKYISNYDRDNILCDRSPIFHLETSYKLKSVTGV